MGRRKQISDDELLAVARDVFLEQGHGARTAEIARRAGVSEATLFKRFTTKKELFISALKPQIEKLQIEERAGAGDPYENLRTLCGDILDMMLDLIPRVIMIHVQARIDPGTITQTHGTKDSPPITIIRRLGEFFRREVKMGRMECDPEAAANITFSMLHSFAFLESFGINNSRVINKEHYLDSGAEFLWKSLRPE